MLASTRGETRYTDFAFAAEDAILVGRESAGVPEAVHAAADARVVIPMRPGFRSLNVAAVRRDAARGGVAPPSPSPLPTGSLGAPWAPGPRRPRVGLEGPCAGALSPERHVCLLPRRQGDASRSPEPRMNEVSP